MDIVLLGITVVSLIVAFVMSITAWRLMRDEKNRAAARVAALAIAADELPVATPEPAAVAVKRSVKAPWASPPPPAAEPLGPTEPILTHATGFLGATEMQHGDGSRQKSLAVAAAALFVVLSGGLVWMMSGPRGTSAQAVGPNAPLELISLAHDRHAEKLSISGLVRNPANGAPVERLSAVVFLFDRMGTFISSSRANVDFLKLGAGDESPFVVSLDAPPTVARYRVSFRTDDGIVPHVDRRSSTPVASEGAQPVAVEMANRK